MKIKFNQNYRQYQKGDVIDPGTGPAQIYLKIGVAEAIENEIETAAFEEKPKKKRRGRPKKLVKETR